LQRETVQLDRRTLALDVNDALPSITAAPTPAGVVTFAPATITFLAIPAAANRMPLNRSGAPQYLDLGLPWIKK
jgi:hypothetical protein